MIESLKKIPRDSTITLLVNPNNDCVIELVVNDKVLLEFDYAQKAIERDSILGLYLGVFLYALAIAFIVQAVLDFKREFKRENKKESRITIETKY